MDANWRSLVLSRYINTNVYLFTAVIQCVVNVIRGIKIMSPEQMFSDI